MKIQGTFLNSKLGRRIFALFVLCAVLPVVLLSLIAIGQVKNHLQTKSKRELQQFTKAIGMSLYERMILLESEIERVGSLFSKQSYDAVDVGSGLKERFDLLMYVQDQQIHYLQNPAGEQSASIPDTGLLAPRGEKPRVYIQNQPEGFSRVFLSRPVPGGSGHKEFVVGEIKTPYLWKIGASNILPPNTELCVLTKDKDMIISSLQRPQSLMEKIHPASMDQVHRELEWSDADGEYIGTYWSIFMESRFDSQNWIVVLSKAKSDIYAPIYGFERTFVLVLVLAVMGVALLSMINIRFTLVPLEKLKAGIRRISDQDFSARVEVSSKDEFGEVAGIFNAMSHQLDEQFRTIRTMSEIDNAILSSLEPDVIMQTAITGLEEVISCAVISVSIMDKERPDKAVVYYNALEEPDQKGKTNIDFPWQQMLEEFGGSQKPLSCRCSQVLPALVGSQLREAVAFCYAVPVYARGSLMGVVCLGYAGGSPRLDNDLQKAQQLADQMGVALANSSLVQELDRLHWASIRALAKTVDAKSSWTAGHSERVCELAVNTARILGLDERAIEVLRQAALLHDIGKVGIPNLILDKPGKLTPEEYAVIQEHPRIGAKILEPIKEYSEVLPIVLQHHERYDGFGYPDGLKGTEIVYEARILAVADVFEALSSDRPYRLGLPYDEAARFVAENSGSHFDPEIADAFLLMFRQKGKQPDFIATETTEAP